MLLDLHTDFSGSRSAGLVFLSLEEFSIVHCDPHSQGFGIVNKTEVDVFLEFSCFFYDPMDVGNLISYSPWNSPGQNTGAGSLSLLQGIFPTQESNPGLLHCRQILYQLSHQGSP